MIQNKLKKLFIDKIFLENNITIKENILTFNMEKNNLDLRIKINDNSKLKLIFNKDNKINNYKSLDPQIKVVIEYQLTGNIEKDLEKIKEIIKENKSQLYILSNNKLKINI